MNATSSDPVTARIAIPKGGRHPLIGSEAEFDAWLVATLERERAVIAQAPAPDAQLSNGPRPDFPGRGPAFR